MISDFAEDIISAAREMAANLQNNNQTGKSAVQSKE
jgi:hypothetical protein